MTAGSPLPRRIHSSELFLALKKAGIIADADHCRRVVIDVQVGHAVMVYVERIGDERLLDVAVTLEGIAVEHGSSVVSPGLMMKIFDHHGDRPGEPLTLSAAEAAELAGCGRPGMHEEGNYASG